MNKNKPTKTTILTADDSDDTLLDSDYDHESYEGVDVLHPWLTSQDKRIGQVVDQILNDVAFAGQTTQIKKHLTILLLNFIRMQKSKSKGFIRYSRRNEYWTEFNKSFPNPWDLSSTFDKIVDTLQSSELLNTTKGFITNTKINGKTKNIRRQTRIKPNAKFIQKYITPYDLLNVPLEVHKDFPLVRIHIKTRSKYVTNKTHHIFKEAKGKTPISGFLKETKDKLKSYNTFIKNTDIRLDSVPETQDIIDKVDTTLLRRVYRVFSDAKVTKGGRIYGGFWIHGIRSTHRPYILINNNPTVECDYSSQHACMLYGHCLGKTIEEVLGKDVDPYIIEGYPRALGKLAFTVALNVRSRKHLKKALENKFKKALKGNNISDKEEAEKLMPYLGNNFDTFMDAFEGLHKAILKPKRYLYPNTNKEKWWHKFQFFDSQIAMYILEQTRLKGIPCLSVHDSFIVEDEHEETLKKIMKEAYLKVDHIDDLSQCIPEITTKRREKPQKVTS